VGKVTNFLCVLKEKLVIKSGHFETKLVTTRAQQGGASRDESDRPSVTWCLVSWPQQEMRRRGGERRQRGNEVGGDASDETTDNQSTRQHGATSQ
jgi:hypothetical protein